MSQPPYCWTKTNDFSLAPLVRPPAIVHCSIVIRVPRDWLQTTLQSPPSQIIIHCHQEVQNDGSGKAYAMVQLRKQQCIINSGNSYLPVDLYSTTTWIYQQLPSSAKCHAVCKVFNFLHISCQTEQQLEGDIGGCRTPQHRRKYRQIP